MTTISSLNVRATIKAFTTTQDADTGRPVTGEPTTWEKWTKATQLSGSRVLENMGIAFKEAWQFEMLYETSRPTLSKYYLVYKGKEMAIAEVERTREGFAWFEKVTAYTTQ